MTAPDRTLIQISDAHLEADATAADGLVALAAELLVGSGLRPDAVLVTGDLSEDGSPSSYRRIRAMLDPLGAALGAPVVVLPGNHDDVPALSAELLGGDPVDRVVTVDGLRIVALDSTVGVAGVHHGELADEQLDWLADVLAQRAPHGTILALHHPPIPSVSPVLQRLALRRPERLASVVARSDVRLIVCGHVHQTAASTLAGIPVWSAPALVSTTDPLPPLGRARVLAHGGGFTRIDLFGDTTVTTALPLLAQPDLGYDVPLAERLALLD